MGLKTALDQVIDIDGLNDLKNSFSKNKKFEEQFTVEYENELKQAYFAFKYQRIWDSRLLKPNTLHRIENQNIDEIINVIGVEIDLMDMKKHVKGG